MKTIEELKKTLKPFQIEKLLEIIIDFHWMARRYADGRRTYSTGLFNDHTRVLQSMEVPLHTTGDNALFARDGMGRAYDKLSQEEARLAEISQSEQYFLEIFHASRSMLGILPRQLEESYQQWLQSSGRKESE